MNRPETIEQIRSRKESWDIVVIGGGATGVGCAVDAASRGLNVLLLEQHDFGKGTSSRSTKLVHGGVRYLAQGDVKLVREALRERGLLLSNAPHAVTKQSFAVPCYSRWEKFYYGAGLKTYDLLAGKYSFGRSRLLSRAETTELLPNIKQEGLVGGVLYHDGQFDDARLLIDLIRTAHQHGAAVLNYAKVVRIEKCEGGNARGARFEDILSGERLTVAARAVINATGAFCDSVRKLSDEAAEKIVTHSQGVHLVFDKEFLASDTALMIPKTADGRVLFCIPWHGYTLVGTTDTPIQDVTLEPQAHDCEIDFILETAAGYLAKPPSRNDILSVFTGIRPLAKASVKKRTAALSRGHIIEIDTSGMLTITGGKWTTYRKMAEDAVDQAIRLAHLSPKPCRTEDLRISFESRKTEGEWLHPRLPYTTADVLYAIREEMAQTLEDILARRTRALFLNAKAAIEAAPSVAAIMATEWGKDQEWITSQIEEFNKTAQHYIPVTP